MHTLTTTCSCFFFFFFFFFNDTATTEIYTLSLHDALPISDTVMFSAPNFARTRPARSGATRDRKSTRLNSSHVEISYAVFCLKKKKKPINAATPQEGNALVLGYRAAYFPPCRAGRRRRPTRGRAAAYPPRPVLDFFFNVRAAPEISPSNSPHPLRN